MCGALCRIKRATGWKESLASAETQAGTIRGRTRGCGISPTLRIRAANRPFLTNAPRCTGVM